MKNFLPDETLKGDGTGLPTKDESSETTVQNLNFLFLLKLGFTATVNLFPSLQNHYVNHQSTHCVLKSQPLW